MGDGDDMVADIAASKLLLEAQCVAPTRHFQLRTSSTTTSAGSRHLASKASRLKVRLWDISPTPERDRGSWRGRNGNGRRRQSWLAFRFAHVSRRGRTVLRLKRWRHRPGRQHLPAKTRKSRLSVDEGSHTQGEMGDPTDMTRKPSGVRVRSDSFPPGSPLNAHAH